MNMTPSRRTFLQSAAAAPMLFAPAVHAFQAGKKFRTALIGCGWWGKNILAEAMAAGRTKVVGLCDVDQNALEATADEVADKTGDAAKRYKDFRELLDKEKPEIVIIATPDHWHALPSIAALKAGAHVFVEKPTGHTVNESRAMLKAAQASGKVVQVGLHRRIGPHHVSGMKFLKSGAVGKIGQVRMFVSGRGGPEAPAANVEPPKGMDWDMYCGPAPLRPFNRKIHPGGFRNFLDFANGTFGDWGAHWVDQLLWWTEEKYPKRVFSAGGRPISGPVVFNDKGQTTDTPDEQVAVFEFEGFTATWEHRKFADNNAEKHKIGAYFYGTNGTFHMGWRDGWTFHSADDRKPAVHEKAVHHHERDGHNVNLLWADFLDAIDKGRKPVADIEPAHRSTVTTLLGMLSFKAGRSIRWDGTKEQIIDDAEANKMLSRNYRGPWEYPSL